MSQYTMDEVLGMSEEELDELVHDFQSKVAGEINNCGKDRQIAFLQKAGVVEPGGPFHPELPPGRVPTEEQQARYLECGGTHCPFCGDDGTNLEGGSFQCDAGIAWQDMTCNACGSSWTDRYTLTHVTDWDGQGGWFVVIGRIPFDDEDTPLAFRAESEQAAVAQFREAMWIGKDRDGLTEDLIDEDGSPKVYVTTVVFTGDTKPDVRNY